MNNTYSRDYDLSQHPAMPVADVQLFNLKTDTSTDSISAIIDSGADNSIFPVNYLRQISARRLLRKARMTGIYGISEEVELYMVGIRIGMIEVTGINVIADKRNRDAIIGRDVLNRLIVTLDGLAQVMDMRD